MTMLIERIAYFGAAAMMVCSLSALVIAAMRGWNRRHMYATDC